MNKFSYKIFWSEEDNEFVAVCIDMPGLTGLGPTQLIAIEQCISIVRAWEDWTANEDPE
jgi:hypothetical protein